MGTHVRAAAVLLALLAAAAVPGRIGADEDAATARVRALLAELAGPDPPDRDRNGTIDAYEALEALGAPAAPLLVDAAVGSDPKLAVYAQRLLAGVGRPAVAPIRARWADLNDERRWALVPVLEKHDRESVREYAWNCLDATGPVRFEAWRFHLRAKDPRAKERYFRVLDGHDGPHVRWALFPGERAVYDEPRENALLVEWLRPDGWVAKGEGRVPLACIPPPWWPDGRDLVVDVLGRRGVARAAQALVELLAEKGPGRAFLGHAVIPVLGAFGDKAAVPELKRVLAAAPAELYWSPSGPERLRAEAAQALWQLGDPAGRPVLIGHLKSDQWFHRRFAAEAVARFATKADLPVFAGMLDDEDWGVREAASAGLERVTGLEFRDGRTRPTDADAPRWKAWLREKR